MICNALWTRPVTSGRRDNTERGEEREGGEERGWGGMKRSEERGGVRRGRGERWGEKRARRWGGVRRQRGEGVGWEERGARRGVG